MARNIKTETSPSGENLGARNWRLEFSLHHGLPTHVKTLTFAKSPAWN